MSEQQIEQEQEEEQEEQEEEEKEEKQGTDFVELTPEQEARFNRIYGNMKQYERVNAQLLRDQKVLLQKTERLQEKVDGVVQDSTEQRLASLRAEKTAAYEAGEIDRVVDIDEQIAQAREVKTPEPEPEPEPEGLPAHIAVAIEHWSSEIGENGLDYIRPWAHPGHPKFNEVARIGQQVMDDPSFASTQDVLDEIDKRMLATLPKKERTSPVLPGDLIASPKKSTPTKLSVDQKDAAHRLYDKMTPKEAEARYATALGAEE